MKYLISATLFFTLLSACKKDTVVNPITPVVQTIDQTDWASILRTYVDQNGDVNYQGLAQNSTPLVNYLAQLGSIDINSSDFNEQDKIAYWINLYNAATLKLVVDHLPIVSINDINGGSPWDTNFIDVNGTLLSLNHIEHQILRTDFDEPRIHFAVNCASISCPALLDEPFTGDNLETNLQEQAVRFINNGSKNVLVGSPIQISALFDWFQSDFTSNGNVVSYLNQYSSTTIDTNVAVTFLPYDWNLNDQ